MGKNKNKNKNKSRKSDENFGREATTTPEKRIVRGTASSLTTSSSFASREPSPTHRTSGSTSELPILSSCSGPVGQSKANDEKRDSVISSTWEGRRQSLASILEPVIPHVWGLRPRRWWPCRTYRWTKDFFFALGRACTGPRWYDLLLTLFTVTVVVFAGYVALELGLSMLKTASAQDTTADTGCSVVYVTVPGPIITISLINASPSNPAKGTYYFSVVNGTTEWMNSITPPSQFSTLITKTPEITPIISSVSVAPSSGTSLSFSTVPSTTSQYTTSLSIATSSVSVLPSSTLSLPPSRAISSVTITITSIATGGQTTILTRVTETTIEGTPPRATSSVASPITSAVITTLISTIPNGSTSTTVVTSNTIVVISPPASLSNIVVSTATSPSTLTMMSSSIPTMSTSIFSSVQTTPMTLPSTTRTSAPSSPMSPPSSSVTRSPSMSSTPGSSFTISLPSPSASGSTATTSAPLITTSTATRVTSDMTTTLTLLPTTSVSTSVSPPFTPSASSSSVPASSTSSTLTSSAPSSSMFAWPSSSTLQSSGISSAGTPSMTSFSSSSSSMVTSNSRAGPSTPVLSSASSSSSSAITPSSTGTRGSSVLPSSSSTNSFNTTSSSTSISSSSSSSRILTSTTTGGVPGATSPSMFSSLVPPMNTTSSFSSRSTSSSSSSSPPLLISSGVTSAATSGSTTSTPPAFSSSVSNTAISTLSASSATGSMTIQTDTTARFSSSPLITTSPISAVPTGSTSSVSVQGLTTKVISYGDTEFSFVFPSPDITTTISYWTGANPIGTGPLPSDLQTVVPTTRSTTQTPISALPSFSIFSSRPRSFKTVVTTIYDDDGPDKRDVKREATPQVSESLLTTTVEIASPTSAGIAEPPGPTTCGESGNFTLNFDDTTVSSTGDQIHAVHGLRNPYHHLFYANGYTDMPDKWEPYPAISQPNVAMFLPVTGKVRPNQPFAGTLLPGELGAGPRASVDAYWFNAHSGYFGCALNGVTPCLLRISGFRYDATLQTEVLVAEQNATLPVCPLYIRCRLTQVFFNEQFRALSGIQFKAFTAGLKIAQIHMLDDLQLEWYNNTCSAGILRIGHS